VVLTKLAVKLRVAMEVCWTSCAMAVQTDFPPQKILRQTMLKENSQGCLESETLSSLTDNT